MHRLSHFDIHFWSNIFLKILFEHDGKMGFIYWKCCKVFLFVLSHWLYFKVILINEPTKFDEKRSIKRNFFCFNSIHMIMEIFNLNKVDIATGWYLKKNRNNVYNHQCIDVLQVMVIEKRNLLLFYMPWIIKAIN